MSCRQVCLGLPREELREAQFPTVPKTECVWSPLAGLLDSTKQQQQKPRLGVGHAWCRLIVNNSGILW